MKKEISPKQQVVDLIKKSNSILLLTHTRPDGDAISSILSLKFILEKINKNVDAVVPDEIPEEYRFLPGIDSILKKAELSKDLIVSIDALKGKIDKISYNKKENGGLDLIITPSEGNINKEDVAISNKGLGYDLVIILDTASLDIVSDIYKENQSLFSDIPVVNIDHHPTNTKFGQVNLVDESSTSVCEILVSLAEALGKDLIDDKIATLLLAGIVTDTNRFQNSNTTPKSLTVAAQLIAFGAKRSEIVKNIYKTKAVSKLKIWGKVLSNIKEDKENKIVWSSVSKNEIENCEAKAEEVDEGVMNELLSSAPSARVVLLLVERERGLITGSMRTSDEKIDLSKVALLFDGGGHKQAAGFRINDENLAKAEEIVLGKIREYLLGNKKPKKIIHTTDRKKTGETKVIFEEEASDREPEVTPESLYAPSVSDVNYDNPKIENGNNSILQRVIESRKNGSSEEIDFAKLEKDINSKREIDEDYE